MELKYSEAELAFREEVRAFIRDNLPEDLRAKVARGTRLTRQEITRWHKILYERGWVAPKWPVEYGGTDWTPTQHHIFMEEAAGKTPTLSPFGIMMIGHAIYTFGTDEQKKRYLPRILNGDEWWCQGYSEPGAGSDLASLQTRAERRDDCYVVNGQKIWTTDAHMADMIFCLVRTDPNVKKQQGISLLLIDMRSPGVTVKPLRSIDGVHHFNEVFFEDVRVPVGNRIGDENKGWTYAKFILSHERMGGGHALAKYRLERLKEIAAGQTDGHGAPLVKDPAFRARLAQLEIDSLCLEYTYLRVLSAVQRGEAPGVESASLLKAAGTEFMKEVTEMTLGALANHGAVWEPQQPGTEPKFISHSDALGMLEAHFVARQSMIYGGSAEIQRNVLAKAWLGL